MLTPQVMDEHKTRLAEIAKISEPANVEAALKVAVEKHGNAVRDDKARELAAFAAANDVAGGDLDGDDIVLKSTRKEDVIQFQEWQDGCNWLRVLLGRKGVDVRETKYYRKGVKVHQRIIKNARAALPQEISKALYTTQVGGIYEWIPTEMSSQIIDAVRMERLVPGLFQQLTMLTPTFTPPILLTDTVAYKLSEETANDPSTGIRAGGPVSSNFSLTAKKLGLRTPISEEALEDSIVQMLPLLNRQLVMSVAAGKETAIINGDITAVHQDADVTASYDAQTLWRGLRKHAIANSLTLSFANNYPTDAYLMQTQVKMGKYGVNPRQQALIVGMRAYMAARQNIAAIRTADQWGSTDSAFRTGAFAVWGGVPVIVSEFMKENLNASGVYDLTTQNYGGVLLVNRDAWVLGEKRGITLKTTINDNDQQKLIVTWRGDFASIYGSAATSVGYGYYVKVS